MSEESTLHWPVLFHSQVEKVIIHASKIPPQVFSQEQVRSMLLPFSDEGLAQRLSTGKGWGAFLSDIS